MRAAIALSFAAALAACAASLAPVVPTAPVPSTPVATISTMPAAEAACADDAGWNDPAIPRRIHGDTFFVGTCGITALLVTSDAGHVLLDAGTEKAAPLVLASIRSLGFRVEDIRYIVNSHSHHDHAGGIAEIKRASGATVVAMDAALPSLRSGRSEPRDPQHGRLSPYMPIGAARRIGDGGVLTLGPLALTAHATPGHAPGGTSWTWRSCEGAHCVDIAFVDSLTAVSAPGYRFSDVRAHPAILPTFRATFDRVAALPCDVLLTPHPQASGMWSRLGPRADRPLAAPGACVAYADVARARLGARLAEEAATP